METTFFMYEALLEKKHHDKTKTKSILFNMKRTENQFKDHMS
jgi:hypothetical protein